MKLWVFAEIGEPPAVAGKYLCLQVTDPSATSVSMLSDEILLHKFDFVVLHPRDYWEYFERFDDGIFSAIVLEDEDERRHQTELENRYRKTVHFYEHEPIRSFFEMTKAKHPVSEEDAGHGGKHDSAPVVDFLKDLPRIDAAKNLIMQVFQSVRTITVKAREEAGFKDRIRGGGA